jgi:hypothetical protein
MELNSKNHPAKRHKTLAALGIGAFVTLGALSAAYGGGIN